MMCVYFEVSRSGYYDWLKPKDEPDKDDVFGALIKQCQAQTKQTYGYRRVKLRLMRKYGLRPISVDRDRCINANRR